MLTQVGIKKGENMFGDRGIAATYKEMKQFDNRKVVQTLTKIEITPEVRSKALEYLMFLKEKQIGKINGRVCAEGCPQRVYTTKMETSSPTACT